MTVEMKIPLTVIVIFILIATVVQRTAFAYRDFCVVKCDEPMNNCRSLVSLDIPLPTVYADRLIRSDALADRYYNV